METPPVEVPEKTFVDLPLDLQRTIIDKCISNRSVSVSIRTDVDEEMKTYELPYLLQITYRCSNKNCNEVVSSRFFRTTVVGGSIAHSRPCSKCREGKMYTSHKTAVLEYYLGEKRKKKLKGLEKFLFKQLDEDRELYGPPVKTE